MAKQNTTKYLSNKQEKSVAKDVGGKTVIASGSIWSMKADARSYNYLIECKTTHNSYYSLTYETWRKIAKEALKDGMRIPVMAIELENSEQMAVFDLDDFNVKLPELHVLGCEILRTRLDSKSFRVTNKPQVVYRLLELPPTLVIIPWQDFLDVFEV